MASIDDFAGSPAQNVGAHHPATSSEIPTSDVPLARVCRALYVGTGGNLSVIFRDNSAAMLKNVPSGTILPIRIRQVNSAGLTAGDLVALS